MPNSSRSAATAATPRSDDRQPGSAGAGEVQRLEAGQQVAFDREHVQAVHALPSGAGAWVKGMLSVDDWRLADFIAELQRYRPGHLGCAPAVANLRISGAFHLASSDAILDNLTSTLPVRLRRFRRYWTRVEAA